MNGAGEFVSVGAPPVLARLVDAFWAFESGGGAQRILPDGCIDFIFDLATGYAHVQGPMTTAEVIATPAGARVFGVRFLPGAASAFLDMDAEEIEDRAVGLDVISSARTWSLAERVVLAKDHAGRQRAIADFLLEPRARKKAADIRLAHAIRAIRHSRGALPVAAIARDLAMSERTLERLFRAHVGVRPKLFARIARLEWTRRVALENDGSQAAIAAIAGYADEPHLVREFRALTGLTPSALAAEERVGFVQGAEPDSR